MTRMTNSISLVLIGSSLILSGCGKPRSQMTEEEKREYDARHRGGYLGYGHGGSGWFHGSGSHSSGISGSGGAKSSVSSHSGGFGSSGHAAGG